MQSKPPHLTSDCGIMFSWAHTWYHFATSAHLVQCKCKSQHRRGRGKKWSAAAFIIFHHQLFTTLFAGPKKHFTCPRQEKTILTVESRLKGLTLWSLLRQPSTRMELMCWKNAKVHFFFFWRRPTCWSNSKHELMPFKVLSLWNCCFTPNLLPTYCFPILIGASLAKLHLQRFRVVSMKLKAKL